MKAITKKQKVLVCVSIYCQDLCIQIALLPFREAMVGSYAVPPMMLPLLKHFGTPLLEIPFQIRPKPSNPLHQ